MSARPGFRSRAKTVISPLRSDHGCHPTCIGRACGSEFPYILAGEKGDTRGKRRFDRLTRFVSEVTSRRSVVRGLTLSGLAPRSGLRPSCSIRTWMSWRRRARRSGASNNERSNSAGRKIGRIATTASPVRLPPIPARPSPAWTIRVRRRIGAMGPPAERARFARAATVWPNVERVIAAVAKPRVAPMRALTRKPASPTVAPAAMPATRPSPTPVPVGRAAVEPERPAQEASFATVARPVSVTPCEKQDGRDLRNR